MNKVLVTGGTGFLGQKLALKLHSLDQDVTVIGRHLKIGQQLQQLGLKFLPIDLTDSKAVIEAIAGYEDIFHCAALSSPWGRKEDFYTTNVLGTRYLVKACLNAQIRRLIYVSTSAVYFNRCDRFKIKETDSLAKHPIHPYIQTKQLAEQEITKGYQQGLSVISIRPRGIFGPGDTAILPRLLTRNQTTGIPLIKRGKAIIDMTYIDNVVDALILCQTASEDLSGRFFNITNDEPTQLLTLLKLLSNKLDIQLKLKPLFYPFADFLATLMEFTYSTLLKPQEPPFTRYTVGLLAFSQTLDITAAKTELGYQPKITIEQGLEKFADWWKHHNPD